MLSWYKLKIHTYSPEVFMFNKQLTAFVCAADCGSFTKAAEQLFISPTAVMKKSTLWKII